MHIIWIWVCRMECVNVFLGSGVSVFPSESWSEHDGSITRGLGSLKVEAG